MSVRRIPLGEATTAQLRTFAKDTLGIGLPFLSKEATLAKIQAAWDKPYIEVSESGAPAAAPAPAKQVAAPAVEVFSDEPLTADEIVRGNVPLDKSGQPTEAPAIVRARLARDEERVTVIISPGPGDDGNDDVKLSINGRAMTIRRGVPSSIRRPYLEALENSREIHYSQVTLPDGTLDMQSREVPGYLFSKVA